VEESLDVVLVAVAIEHLRRPAVVVDWLVDSRCAAGLRSGTFESAEAEMELDDCVDKTAVRGVVAVVVVAVHKIVGVGVEVVVVRIDCVLEARPVLPAIDDAFAV